MNVSALGQRVFPLAAGSADGGPASLAQTVQDLCAPSRPQPPDELLKLRRQAPWKRAGAIAFGVGLGALAGAGHGVLAHLAGAYIGVGVAVLPAVLVGVLPLAVGLASNSKKARIAGVTLGIAGGLGCLVGGGWLGYQLAGQGPGLVYTSLSVLAGFMFTGNSGSGALDKAEKEYRQRLEAFQADPQARRSPVEAPSNVQETETAVTIGGIRLPRRLNKVLRELQDPARPQSVQPPTSPSLPDR